MTTEQKPESASLAFNDLATGGSSDKVYHLNLEPSGKGFTVTAQYGRRGGVLATDNKTKNGALPFEAAKKLFDKVLREKIAKGYVASGTSAPASQIEALERRAGDTPAATAPVRPQELLTEIDEREVKALIASDDYWMQDKSDGHSRGAVKTADGTIFGLNKLGKRVPLPGELHAELSRINLRTFQIDAELVGNKLVCRDLLDADGDISASAYEARFVKLVAHVSESAHIAIVETWAGDWNKAAAFVRSESERREGVVFKLRSARHRSGRNGQHKKFKFVKTCSVVAGEPRATGKDSVEIYLLDCDKRLSGAPGFAARRVGTVSLIGKPKVKQGDVLEVAYLYAYPSKMLVQARLLRVRDDVEASECTTAQLVFKREE